MEKPIDLLQIFDVDLESSIETIIESLADVTSVNSS